MNAEEYNFPVWGTQGGGLVRSVGDKFIFVTKSDCPGLDIGDEMPEEWGIIPANQLARDESDPDFEVNAGFDEFFETAFAMRDRGEISLATIRDFFPEVVKARNQRLRDQT